MNKIVEVARNHKEIISGTPVTCACGEMWFSLFDKLYVTTYNKCSTCSTPEELERLSENIFALLEAQTE